MDNERKVFSQSLLYDALAIASLAVLVVVFYWRLALAGRVLAGGDIFTYFYPYWAEATRAFRAGRLPLWNPNLFMGVPFLANSQVGFFYPLNWFFWLLLPAHRAVHLTLVFHLCLAALSAYVWGRASLALGRVGAWTVGLVFALNGYLGAQVEHVNQLQGVVWLPLMLTMFDWVSQPASQISEAVDRRPVLGPRLAFVGLAVVVGLVILAGHTQAAFIAIVGLAVYGLSPALWEDWRRDMWAVLARRALLLVAAVGLGVTLAAVQLIPTWRLSRLSVRAQGLPFNERLSFSLSPFYLARALLPGWAGFVPPVHIEHVAYVGLVGLIFLWGAVRHRPLLVRNLICNLILLAVGLSFALGLYNPLYLLLARYVPGFAHFRVPARWLVLYVVGAAGLSGQGAEALWRGRWVIDRRAFLILAGMLLLLIGWGLVGVRLDEGARVDRLTVVGWVTTSVMGLGLLLVAPRRPRLAALGLLGVLVLELFAATATLPHSRATVPQAFTSLRPAMAHLVASEEEPPARFISMSDITFDPGDLPAIERIYGSQLPDGALYDYIVATKQKEVLSPNLPLAFDVQAADGYDGGVLPLAHYAALQRLLLPEEQIYFDGRLRENLVTVPGGRWLNLFNVRYLITDKLRDAWVEGVFYDLQFGARLSRDEMAAVDYVPNFKATAIGLVAHLEGGSALPDDQLVALIEITFAEGTTHTFELHAGDLTDEVGSATRLRWSVPALPASVVVRGELPQGELVLRGVSLIDERTESFQSLLLSDRGSFRLVHSGDVKIYENLDVLPRAFIVQQATCVSDDQAALSVMEDPAFDPATEVVLTVNDPSCIDLAAGDSGPDSSAHVEIATYRPERVEVEVTLDEPGYLVLTDGWYPQWEVSVDGEPTPIRRANLLFRAVALRAGNHRVVFTYRARALLTGGLISLGGLVALGALGCWAPFPVAQPRRSPSRSRREKNERSGGSLHDH